MGYCEDLNERIRLLRNIKYDNLKRMDELLLDENVREFLQLYKNNEEINKSIDSKERELIHLRFVTCQHAYVITDISMNNGQVPIYKCVKCGLTNESVVKDNSLSLKYPFSLMGNIFKDSFRNSYLIYDDVIDIPFEEIAKIYEIITNEYPNINLLELREKIKYETSIIKKLLSREKEGKTIEQDETALNKKLTRQEIK